MNQWEARYWPEWSGYLEAEAGPVSNREIVNRGGRGNGQGAASRTLQARDPIAHGFNSEIVFSVTYMHLHSQDGEHEPLLLTLKLDDGVGTSATMEKEVGSN